TGHRRSNPRRHRGRGGRRAGPARPPGRRPHRGHLGVVKSLLRAAQQAGPPVAASRLWLPVHGSFELRLGHAGAALDVAPLRLLVQLIPGPALRARVGPLAASPGSWSVLTRHTRRGARLTGLGSFLVHRTGGDLLRPVLGLAAGLRAGPNVLVLALSLGAPR